MSLGLPISHPLQPQVSPSLQRKMPLAGHEGTGPRLPAAGLDALAALRQRIAPPEMPEDVNALLDRSPQSKFRVVTAPQQRSQSYQPGPRQPTVIHQTTSSPLMHQTTASPPQTTSSPLKQQTTASPPPNVEILLHDMNKTLSELQGSQVELESRVADLHRVVFEEHQPQLDDFDREQRDLTRIVSHLDAAFQVTSGQIANALAQQADARAEVSGLSQVLHELQSAQNQEGLTHQAAEAALKDGVVMPKVRDHLNHEVNRVIEMVNQVSSTFEKRFELFQAPYEDLEMRLRKQSLYLDQLRRDVDRYSLEELPTLQGAVVELQAASPKGTASSKGTASPKSMQKVCTNCGSTYGPNARFCRMCGKARDELSSEGDSLTESSLTEFLKQEEFRELQMEMRQVKQACEKMASMEIHMGEQRTLIGKIEKLLSESGRHSDMEAIQRLETRIRKTENDFATQAHVNEILTERCQAVSRDCEAKLDLMEADKVNWKRMLDAAVARLTEDLTPFSCQVSEMATKSSRLPSFSLAKAGPNVSELDMHLSRKLLEAEIRPVPELKAESVQLMPAPAPQPRTMTMPEDASTPKEQRVPSKPITILGPAPDGEDASTSKEPRRPSNPFSARLEELRQDNEELAYLSAALPPNSTPVTLSREVSSTSLGMPSDT